MATKLSKSAKAKPALAAVPDADPARPSGGDSAASKGPAADLTLITAEDSADDDHASPAAKGDALKMKDLLAAVVVQTGAKKKDAKDVVDAVLAQMAGALQAGKSLNLPPLGNLRIAKIQDKGGVKMMVLKLRMGGGSGGGAGGKNSGADTLAEDADDS